MKRFYLSICLLAASLVLSMVKADTQVEFEPPFMSEPLDATVFLPAPPATTSGAWYNDFYYYQWGKEQRQNDSIRSRAIADYHGSSLEYLEEMFSPVFGQEISEDNTPVLHHILNRAMADAHRANSAAKGTHERLRPFVQFGEESIEPESDEEERAAFSYPSGHTTRCYALALILAMVNPAATENLMLTAYQYSMNRVICGHHYKSDVDAGTLLSMAVVARLQASEEFVEQLAKAKEEFKENTTMLNKVAAAKTRSDAKKLVNNTVLIFSNDQIYSVTGTPQRSMQAQ